jgi:transposase
MKQVPELLHEDAHKPLPPMLRSALRQLYEHYVYLTEQIRLLEREIEQALRSDEVAERLLSIPGIGPITASFLCSQVGDVRQYANARDFAAAIGLAPRQHSTGGRTKMLGITKRGDATLRRLLVQCARSVLLRIDKRNDALSDWARELRLRRHANVVACAVAAKLARIVWAVLARGGLYRPYPAVAAPIGV